MLEKIYKYDEFINKMSDEAHFHLRAMSIGKIFVTVPSKTLLSYGY